MTLRGDYAVATPLLEEWRGRIDAGFNPHLVSQAAGMLAVCRLQAGDMAGALPLCRKARDNLYQEEIDVVHAMTLSRIATVLAAAHDPDAETVAAEARAALESYEDMRA